MLHVLPATLLFKCRSYMLAGSMFSLQQLTKHRAFEGSPVERCWPCEGHLLREIQPDGHVTCSRSPQLELVRLRKAARFQGFDDVLSKLGEPWRPCHCSLASELAFRW